MIEFFKKQINKIKPRKEIYVIRKNIKISKFAKVFHDPFGQVKQIFVSEPKITVSEHIFKIPDPYHPNMNNNNINNNHINNYSNFYKINNINNNINNNNNYNYLNYVMNNNFNNNFNNNINDFNNINNNINDFNNINNNINNFNNNIDDFNNNINDFNVPEEEIYKQPEHLRGLVNIASTCYMNSTVQCFAHIEELFTYFQKPKIIQLIESQFNNPKLFPVFAQLINCMWYPFDLSPLYPNIFKERLGQLNPLFQGAMPNDAKDLLTFMLMQLHEELNNPIGNNNNQNMILNHNMQKDKKAMFKNFASYFKNNYRSIISELFYGLTYNQTQCTKCQATLYNYQTFNFLIFPLAQVLNHKMQLVNFQNNFNNKVTLYECFQYNQLNTPLNDYYCNFCRQTSQANYSNFISFLPNIIIIILNRGAGLEFNVSIDFDENLDLKDYVEYFKDDSFYELFGVVTHYGESGASGHFMARCKSPFDGNWYLYNDAIVQKIGFFTKEEFFRGHPYILFYKKTKFGNK